MEKNIRFCDHCGKSGSDVTHFHVVTGLSTDSVDCRTSEDTTDIDLCAKAQMEILTQMFRGADCPPDTGLAGTIITSREREIFHHLGQEFIKKWKVLRHTIA